MSDITANSQEATQDHPNSLPQYNRLLNLIALSRSKTLNLYRFLAEFQAKGGHKNLKVLRAEFGQRVPYTENLAQEIVEMREDRF